MCVKHIEVFLKFLYREVGPMNKFHFLKWRPYFVGEHMYLSGQKLDALVSVMGYSDKSVLYIGLIKERGQSKDFLLSMHLRSCPQYKILSHLY